MRREGGRKNPALETVRKFVTSLPKNPQLINPLPHAEFLTNMSPLANKKNQGRDAEGGREEKPSPGNCTKYRFLISKNFSPLQSLYQQKILPTPLALKKTRAGTRREGGEENPAPELKLFTFHSSV
jgi:hypothetical protein